MKKKLSKIAALLLAAVMVITGLVVVPRNAVESRGHTIVHDGDKYNEN